MDNQSILIISPHADDEILGCGGILQRVSKATIVVVTHPTVQRRAELEETMVKLKALRPDLHLTCVALNYLDGGIGTSAISMISKSLDDWTFTGYDLVYSDGTGDCELRNYSTVLIPYRSLHQDHQIVNHAAKVYLRNYQGVILEYEYAEGLGTFEPFNPDYFVMLSEAEVAAKADLFSCYASQVKQNRDINAIKSLASIRGYGCNSEYAEAFKLVRYVS